MKVVMTGTTYHPAVEQTIDEDEAVVTRLAADSIDGNAYDRFSLLLTTDAYRLLIDNVHRDFRRVVDGLIRLTFERVLG